MPPVAQRSRSSRARSAVATWDDRLTLEIAGDATAAFADHRADRAAHAVPRGRFDGHGSGQCAQRQLGPDAPAIFRLRHRRRQSRRVRRDAEVVRDRTASRQIAVDAQVRRLGDDSVRPQRPENPVAADLCRGSDYLSLLAAHLHRRSAPPRRDADPRDLSRAPKFRRGRPHRAHPRRISGGRARRRPGGIRRAHRSQSR